MIFGPVVKCLIQITLSLKAHGWDIPTAYVYYNASTVENLKKVEF